MIGNAAPKIARDADINCTAIAVCNDVDGGVLFKVIHEFVSEAGSQLSLG